MVAARVAWFRRVKRASLRNQTLPARPPRAGAVRPPVPAGPSPGPDRGAAGWAHGGCFMGSSAHGEAYIAACRVGQSLESGGRHCVKASPRLKNLVRPTHLIRIFCDKCGADAPSCDMRQAALQRVKDAITAVPASWPKEPFDTQDSNLFQGTFGLCQYKRLKCTLQSPGGSQLLLVQPCKERRQFQHHNTGC